MRLPSIVLHKLLGIHNFIRIYYSIIDLSIIFLTLRQHQTESNIIILLFTAHVYLITPQINESPTTIIYVYFLT
jgi:hypothetical protein